jgi:hypothetical protein
MICGKSDGVLLKSAAIVVSKPYSGLKTAGIDKTGFPSSVVPLRQTGMHWRTAYDFRE